MHPWLMVLTICAMPLGAAVLFSASRASFAQGVYILSMPALAMGYGSDHCVKQRDHGAAIPAGMPMERGA